MRANAATLSITAALTACLLGQVHGAEKVIVVPERESYQDKLIDDGALGVDIWDDFAPLTNTDGPPRGLRIDGLWSNVRRAGETTTQGGMGIGAFLSTAQYGSFSFDGLFTNGEDTSIATLWQRDMPFEGGWRATNGLGMLNSPSIDLVRFQPRIFLPSTPMLGGVTEWRSPFGAQLTAGFGEPGVYFGAYVPEFRRLGGQLANLGGQWAIGKQWSTGIQYIGANDVTSVFQTQTDPRPFNSRSIMAATSRQDANSRFQLNVLDSENSATDPGRGAWFDGYVQDGNIAHSFGLFHLDPLLLWGNQIVANDARGGYYRAFYSSLRWLWDAGADYFTPVEDSRVSTTFLSGSLRYQFFRDLSAGFGGSVRRQDSTAWQGFVFVEHIERYLTGRAQIDHVEDGRREETVLNLNQTWNVPAGTRLNTTVALGRYRDDQVRNSNQIGLAAYGGGDIARNVSLDLNVQWRHSSGEAEPTSTTGSLSLTWSFLPELRLIATGYHSRARSRMPLAVTSPLDPVLPDNLTRINDTGFFAILRYETRAGSLAAPLGGSPGAGAGRIAGVVFLDGNDDGRFAAGEQGAANVTVILNGRYSVRTDAQGRFEFPAVASGRHAITVMSDNLPLPWALVNDGRIEFDVSVRGTVNVDIPAQRIR